MLGIVKNSGLEGTVEVSGGCQAGRRPWRQGKSNHGAAASGSLATTILVTATGRAMTAYGEQEGEQSRRPRAAVAFSAQAKKK